MIVKKRSAKFCFILLITSKLLALDNEKRISELEKQMLEIGAYNSSGTFGASFGQGSVTNSDWELMAEVLFWKANVGATDYAYSVSNVTASGASLPLSGDVSQISFGWDFGFRFGIGKQGVMNEYNVNLIYTRFVTSASDGHRNDLPSGFLGLTGFLDPALSAKSKYHLNYQNIDLLLGKSYFLSSRLLFNSRIGLKFSRIHQKQDSRYAFDIQSGDLLSFSSSLQDRCLFLGVGPKADLNTRWYLGKEFSLFNQAGASLLYGYYKVKDNYHSDESKNINNQIVRSAGQVDLSGSSHQFSPFAELALGISWNKAFLSDKVVVTTSLAYEVLYFWRQAEAIAAEGIIRTASGLSLFNVSRIRFNRQAEDLSFQGVMFCLEIDF